MATTETDHHGGPAKARAAWHLSSSEKKWVTAASGLVLFACALAPYVQPYGSSGMQVFIISLGASVAGGLLIILAVRLITNRDRKITILLLPALTMLVCAGVVGGVAGYLVSHPLRAANITPAPARQKPPTSRAVSPAPTASTAPARGRLFTEIADNRNGVPYSEAPTAVPATPRRFPSPPGSGWPAIRPTNRACPVSTRST